jgi:Flp pilus assembly protein CpaB
VRERLLPGEAVLLPRLTAAGTESGLSALVHTGQRALALNLADAGRVSGFVNPSDIVDVVVTFEDEDGLPAETVTVLVGARVLAVDEKISEDADGTTVTKPQVTLAVGAADAERVTHAARMGKARLTLHAMADDTTVLANVDPGLPGPRLGESRLTVAEWRETVSVEELEHMEVTLERARHPEQPVAVDPRLLRPVTPGAVR